MAGTVLAAASRSLTASGRQRRQHRGRGVPRSGATAVAAASTQEIAAEVRGTVVVGTVSKRVGDIAVIAVPLVDTREHVQDELPEIGDPLRFSCGATGYVIAVSDLCFAAALSTSAELVEEGETYELLPESSRPTVVVPKFGAAFVDPWGNSYDADTGTQGDVEGERARTTANWFQEITDLIKRQRIDAPLHAGVMGLDAFVPIGRGQSMLLRLPSGLSRNDLDGFLAHIARAQGDNDVLVVTAAPNKERAEHLKSLLAGSGVEKRFVVVAPRQETVQAGQTVLAMHSACAIAEAHRDSGGDALVLLDIEPLSNVWSVLADVLTDQGLTERKNKEQNDELATLSDDMGVELWKYVARKNALSGSRRSLMGCFLQRASRCRNDGSANSGGSLTLLAFARLKDDTKLTRAELESKLRNVLQMPLDKKIREKAVEKIEAQLAALPAEDSAVFGVPDDFIEEAKAVTDGHVTFAPSAAGQTDGVPKWTVDLRESVARGITALSLQSRPMHMLRSLGLKMPLMNHDGGDELGETLENSKIDLAPLMSLLQQPVGDVLSVEDEAAMLMMAMSAAKSNVAARTLADEAVELLSRARVRIDLEATGDDARAEIVVAAVRGARRWAEDQLRTSGLTSLTTDETPSLRERGADAIESLADFLELRPLERKRLAAAAEAEDGPLGDAARKAGAALARKVLRDGDSAADQSQRYIAFRARLGDLWANSEELMQNVAAASAGRDDEELMEQLAELADVVSR